MQLSEKTLALVGWFGCIMAIAMFSSYIDQIQLNLAGNPGSIILPIATIVNCVTWMIFGFCRKKKEWPIVVPNVIGIALGVVTAVTAVIH